MNDRGQTICLCMIVKDEAHVIARCLESVRPLIDSWAIVDTGSTDGTQDVVRELLADLPGELADRPWKDFAHNRNESLDLARGRADYVLIIDADEVLDVEEGFKLPRLTADSYVVEVVFGNYAFGRRQILRDALPWHYRGVLHEYVECDQARTEAVLDGLRTYPHHDGARARDPDTYRRDVLVLEQALTDEPDNARNVFYLAQSYRDAGDLDAAIRTYRRRAEMGGWADEAWLSLYQVAQLLERQERPWGEALEAYLAAFDFLPDRAGPLFRVGLHYQRAGMRSLAHLFLARAMEVPTPQLGRLFVEGAIYDYLLPLEYAVSAYYVDDHETAVATNNALLLDGKLPPAGVRQVIENRRFSLDVRHPREPGGEPGRIWVVTKFRDPGPELEESVAQLLAQEDADFEGIVFDDRSSPRLSERLPADPRLRVVRLDRPVEDDWQLIAELVEGDCAPNDVLVPLPTGTCLADRNALATVRRAFDDRGCELLYAPQRGADGRPGRAVPAASAVEHDEAGDSLAAESPVVFRASLHAETRGNGGRGLDRAGLWNASGFARTRFADEPLTRAVAARAPLRGGPSAVVARARDGERPPLISCLMVTRDRLSLAMRAMRSYADQTYPARELVVVSEGDPWYRAALQRYADEQGIAGVRVIRAEPGTTLGALRNLTLDAAHGEFVCQWDDDDCSHPDRLGEQFAALQREKAEACFLTDHLQYVEDQGLVLWIDWTGGGRVTGEWQLFPGSLMMRRNESLRYPEIGPYARRGEDSYVVGQLNSSAAVARVAGLGHLYLYHYHGGNTFPREHHERIGVWAAPNETLAERAADIHAAIDYYGLPRPVVVGGRAGPAFVVG